jgi:hypothetical protein
VASSPSGAVRFDARTGKTLVTLAASAGAELAGVPGSRYVMSGGDVLRAWDVHDGRLLWSMPTSSWCAVGLRLYPTELCD